MTPELSTLGVDISISEWSNDRSLKSWRTLQSLSLCFSVKTSGCRTSRNTWGPGSERLTQFSTCFLSLSSEMFGSSRSGVLMRTISFSFNCPLTLWQQSGSSSVLNSVFPSMKFPTELLSDQLFPSRTTLSSDTGNKTINYSRQLCADLIQSQQLKLSTRENHSSLKPDLEKLCQPLILYISLNQTFWTLLLWNTVNSDLIKHQNISD